jgi:chromatin remodeling complex protein RSC6
MSERKVGMRGKRRIQPGFMTPVKPDEKLSAIIGTEPLPRSELTKRLWNYIRKHGLQDEQKKSIINADENLRQVFNGKDQVTMFEMSKLVFSHTVQE